ncbi:MAG: hypothetical protein R3F19_01130 [Verrucomicrobiales bacterium]
MRFASTLHAVILVFAILLGASCSKRTEEPLVGQWANTIEEDIIGKWTDDDDEGSLIEFFSDNTFRAADSMSDQFSGKWTKVSGDEIKIDTTTSGEPESALYQNIEISGSKMTFSVDEVEGSYTRAK